MNLSAPFIRRPIATVLLTIGLALAGVAGFAVLPVAPLPQVDHPVISVSANLAGASPATMAGSASGGYCRSASMKPMISAFASAMPWSSERPFPRAPSFRNARTGNSFPSSLTSSQVPSLELSSMKMIS